MIDDLISYASRRMDKSVESTQTEFNTVRTGRASAALLDRITVDYYGHPTPLQQLATLTPGRRAFGIEIEMRHADDLRLNPVEFV